MSGLISISSSGGNGIKNNAPTITNLRVFGDVDIDGFTIKYIAKDTNNTILRHYIYINGEKKEISKDVGYESTNNEFTYKISGLEKETNYNIQIEITDGFEIATSSINVKTDKLLVYGVKVMENNSNPSTCCTYIENAVGVNPAIPTSLEGWLDKYPFNRIRVVGFKNGKVTKEINQHNKTQYKDGSTVPLDVDVMIEIPKVYWDFKSISNGYELRISKYKFNNTCGCYAHKVDGVEKDYIYVGAYLGYVEGDKLRSRRGVLPTTNFNLTQFRTYAQANGSGYQQWNWFTLTLIQILYLIAYKNLNSQSALGMGVCSGVKTDTGGTNNQGFAFGSSDKSQQMCFLGIEDFYGNASQWVDGLFINTSFQVLITPNNKVFNNEGNGYKNIGKFLNTNGNGFFNGVVHTNEGGFIPKSFSGSTTTYYSDHGGYNTEHVPRFGGSFNNNLNNGAFNLYIGAKASLSGSDRCSRLCYLG